VCSPIAGDTAGVVGDSVDNQYVEVTPAYTMNALYYISVLTQLLIHVLRLLTVWYGYWCTARSMCHTKYMYVVCGMEAGQALRTMPCSTTYCTACSQGTGIGVNIICGWMYSQSKG